MVRPPDEVEEVFVVPDVLKVIIEPRSQAVDSAAAIVVERSSGVAILGQEITDTRPGRTAAVSIQANIAPGEDGIRVENLQATLAPETEIVLDRRDGG